MRVDSNLLQKFKFSYKQQQNKLLNIGTEEQLNLEECQLQISFLELKLVLFGLKSLCSKLGSFYILFHNANSKMGSSRYIYMDNANKDIWNWTINKRISLIATNISGFKDIEADKESRQ